jgi:non-ribosomal peptide synthetase component F
MYAGAAFWPLDPLLPTSQLQDVVSQCSATLALASNASRATIGPLLSAMELFATSLNIQHTFDPTGNLPLPLANPRSPAYVLFTSGSTG